MKNSTPKQFLSINKEPILLHSLRKFDGIYKKMKLIVVLPNKYISIWEELCEKYSINISHNTVAGGRTRFHSVKNALDSIKNKSGLVAIHDAVRPFVSKRLIKRIFIESKKKSCVIPVVNLNSSIRKVHSNKNINIERSNLKIVQTPQCFRLSLIKKAYEQDYKKCFTDDATVLEKMGYNVNLIKGEENNFKITNMHDLNHAEWLSQNISK